MTLMTFGDSIMDTGNLTAILAQFDIEPFPSPFYNDGKASDGQVLSEAIADRLGVGDNSLISRFELETAPNVFEEDVDYAIAGAETSGSVFAPELPIPTDLQSQIELFQTDYASAIGTTSEGSSIDAIINAGGNNVFNFFLNTPDWFNIFLTSEDDYDDDLIDDLIDNLADEIVDDIDQAIDGLDDAVNNTVILGLAPLGDIPLAIQLATQVDSSLDLIIPGDYVSEIRDLFTETAEEVNEQLIDKFDDVEGVFVVDGIEGFNDALDDWEDSVEAMGLDPITDISYRDSLMGNLGFAKEQFAFLDPVHPTNAFTQFLADEVFQAISSEFAGFGLS